MTWPSGQGCVWASGRAEGADDPELSSRGHGLKAGGQRPGLP